MKRFFLFILIFPTIFCNAQSGYQFGILPSININKSLPNDYKLNVKLESRQLLKEGFFEVENDFDYEYLLTDLTLIGSKKIGINKSLAIGYLFRIREGRIIHRSIQQFIMTKRYPGFRIAHRFSADQSFDSKKATEFRLRYRVSSEIALNGQSVNPKEFYLKVNNEYLNSFQKGDYDLEVRVAPFLGYKFTDRKKFEFGLDYRLNSFLNNNSSNRFWISINWYQVL